MAIWPGTTAHLMKPEKENVCYLIAKHPQMKTFIVIFCMLFVTIACSTDPIAKTEEYYENGTPKLIRYYQKSGDTIPVKEQYFYDDGKIRMEGSFENGERHGKWFYRYANGKIWSSGHYTNGVEDGMKAVYHENGQLYYEGMVTEGKRTGIWKFFDDTGRQIKEVNYDNNRE